MLKINPAQTLYAILLAVILFMAGCSGGSAPSSPPPVVPAKVTWYVPDGSTMTASQMASLFDTNQLYVNVKSAANSNGEIGGDITPSSSLYLTDAGDPFAPNPANNPVTFATILRGDQVRPRNVVTVANGYGSVTLDPLTRQLTGFIATSGIDGKAAQIHDGIPGTSGATVLTLEGGPVVWTVPANTVLTDAQIIRLSAGAFYFNVGSDAFPDGEIRGQLNQQVRFASLKGSSEVPPVSTSATGVGFLALNQPTRQISGFVKVAGLSSAVTTAALHIGAAGTNGNAVVSMSNSGNGIWSVPPNTVLGDAQVANFNNDELYFNIHSEANHGGELRGQILKSGIRIGTASMDGSKEIPPVLTQGAGTGIMALNSVTELVSGSVKTDRVIGTVVQIIHSGSNDTTGAPIIALTTNSPVTVAPTPGLSYALDIQPIFNANCAVAFCHVRGGLAPMSLEPGFSFANMIVRVEPGNSAESYLIRRLTVTDPLFPRMPFNKAPLSTTSLDLIKAWIDNGALDN
jgi:hypothetical protein